MLFVWLCGVAIGVAHACFAPTLADSSGMRAKPVAVGDAVSQQIEHARTSHHAEHDGPLPGHDSLGKPNCQDFCDKSAVSIPPLKTALDDLHGSALPSTASAIAIAFPAASPDHLLLPRRDGGLASPITILFLRLAL